MLNTHFRKAKAELSFIYRSSISTSRSTRSHATSPGPKTQVVENFGPNLPLLFKLQTARNVVSRFLGKSLKLLPPG